MVDFDKTEQVYIQKGLTWIDTTESKRAKNWRQRSTTSQGNFVQNPDDPKTLYPIREVSQIIRNRVLDEDGKEYLTTVETWIGRDGIGNDTRLPINQPQTYQDPTVRISKEIVDGRYQEIRTQDGFKTIYTVPFTREAAEDAYNRSRKTTVSLAVREVGRSRNEVIVKDFDDFVERDFYDLLHEKPKTITVEKTIEKKINTSQKRDIEQLAS